MNQQVKNFVDESTGQTLKLLSNCKERFIPYKERLILAKIFILTKKDQYLQA